MQHYKKVFRPVLFSLALVSAPILASDCGDVPEKPEVVDGATATMDELVANSQSVKTFIADADAFLDCNEAHAKSDKFDALEALEQQAVLDVNSDLLEKRNAIGEEFNKQVSAYKAANPAE